MPHRPDVLIQGIELFKDFAVAVEQSEGLSRLRVFDFRNERVARADVPRADLHRLRLEARRSTTRRPSACSYQSMVTPPSIYDYDAGRRSNGR